MSDYIKKLNDIFQYAYHHKKGSLYRDLYGDRVKPDLKIDSLLAWRQLPFITKDDLLAVPMLKRTFTEPGEAIVLRSSSGTSGKDVLMTLRHHIWIYNEIFENFNPTGMLMIGDKHYGAEHGLRMVVPDIPFISGDLDEPELAVKLAKDLPINFFACWLYGFDIMIPLLEKYGMLEKIQLFQTFGERLEPAMYKKLKAVFPNAMIYTRYGATEMHDTKLGYSIGVYDEEKGSVFSTTTDIYVELIDIDTGEVIEEVGRKGEIVVTMLWTYLNTSPLMRYRMGDMGMYLTYDEDPWKRTYTTLGREELDKISIPGGILLTAEFDRVLADLSEEVDSDYELHYKLDNDEIAESKFELWVKLKKQTDLGDLAERIMDLIKINPSKTYKQGIDHGQLSPLKIKVVEKLSREGMKRRKFIKIP